MTATPATTDTRTFDTVRTVLGDLPTERLGRCDYHEHLFQVSPLLVGDELDNEEASRQEAESLRRAGIDAFVYDSSVVRAVIVPCLIAASNPVKVGCLYE